MAMQHARALLLTLLFAAPAAFAQFPTFTFSPAIPREGETVTVRIDSASDCPGVGLTATIAGNTIHLDAVMSSLCFGALVPYSVTTTFVAPRAGQYSVEYSLSLRRRRSVQTTALLIVTDGTCRFERSLHTGSVYKRIGDEVPLRWCSTSQPASYRVYRAKGRAAAFELIASLPAGTTSHVATASAGGVERYFVEAVLDVETLRTSIVDTQVNANPCGVYPTSVCLADRFAVGVLWSHPGDLLDSGSARAMPLTRESAAFWFFEPTNPEITVKVVDACSSPVPRYWLFVSGMTNVFVRVFVRDTKTYVDKEYVSADGSPFATVVDTNAFPCP
jgi:hypothetical protein